MMKKIRMILDMAMTLILPLLMGYSLVGETAHEVIGITMGILLIAHNYINRKWYTAVFKGRYTPARIMQTAVNFLLLLCFILTMISGIMISKHLFVFMKINIAGDLMRKMHLCAANWAFVLMSFHAGTHGGTMTAKIKHKKAVFSAFAAISAYGIYAFMKRGLLQYMFLRNIFVFFDYSEPYIWFYIDYIAMIVLFMFAGFNADRLFIVSELNNRT